MSLFARDTWREKIRFYAMAMVATLAAFAIIIPVFVIVDRVQAENLLRLQDEFHLTSALEAKSSELEVEKILNKIDQFQNLSTVTSSPSDRQFQLGLEANEEMFVLRNSISKLLSLQEEFSQSEFEFLMNRLRSQSSKFDRNALQVDASSEQLASLKNEFLALQRIFDQIERLHIAYYDRLQVSQIERNRQNLIIFLAIVFIAIGLAYFAIRRGFIAISELTLEQEKFGAELRESKARFRDFATSSADRFWATDANLDWHWVDVTSDIEISTDASLGTNDVGQADNQLDSAAFVAMDDLRREFLARRPFRNLELATNSAGNTTIWWRISGVPVHGKNDDFVGFRGVATDITEQRNAEEQARQLQRLEAVGQMTGGVAHDFNNLLAVILGNLELIREGDAELDRDEFIEDAIAATLRGADLTKSLLSFARRAPLEPKRVDMNQLVRNTKNWGARVLPETIEIETSLLAGIWETEIDPASMESALLNLFLNAREAMPTGGKLTIETANIRIDDDYIKDRKEALEPGRFVMLAVSDTGHGMTSETLARIYEPFYTTKEVGKGSGLGLSMVQGFVKQSGGAIRVYSEIGVGTTFKLYFKAAPKITETQIQMAVEPSSASKQNAHVLLVEDEKDVMKVLITTLENAGFMVTAAINGDTAFNLFCEAGPFDVLVTDIVMPGELQGPALAKAVRARAPKTPVIFMSGYASEATVHGNGLRPEDIRLMKPVRRSEFVEAVSNAIKQADMTD